MGCNHHACVPFRSNTVTLKIVALRNALSRPPKAQAGAFSIGAGGAVKPVSTLFWKTTAGHLRGALIVCGALGTHFLLFPRPFQYRLRDGNGLDIADAAAQRSARRAWKDAARFGRGTPVCTAMFKKNLASTPLLG
jgi:hypothetical protein